MNGFFSDQEIDAMVSSGQVSPQRAEQMKAIRDMGAKALPPAGGETPLTPEQPFQGPTTGLSQDPSTAYKPPETPKPSGYSLDLDKASVPPPAPPAHPGAVNASFSGPSRPQPAGVEPDYLGQMRSDYALGKRERAQSLQTFDRTAQDALDLAEQKGRERAHAMETFQAESQKLEAANAQRDQEYRDRMADKQKQVDSLVHEVDTTKVQDSRGMGQRIGAAIAIGLGAYAQAWNGGENTALKLVQQQIENDLQNQREALANKRSLISTKRGELSDLRNQLGDERAADNVLAARRWKQADLQLSKLDSEYAPAEMKQQIAQTRAQIQGKIAEQTQEAALRLGQIEATDAAHRREYDVKLMTAGSRLEAPPGLRLIAGQRPSEATVSKAREVKGKTDAFLQKLQALADFRQKHGFTVLDRNAVAEGETLKNEAMTAYKDANELGALDKGSLALMNEAVGGDPTGAGFKEAKYKALIHSVDQSRRARLRALGYDVEDGALSSGGSGSFDQTKQAVGFAR